MNSEKFAHNILEKIKEKKVQPKSKWHFLLKDGVVWLLGGIALFVGAVAVAVMVYIMRTHDFELYSYVHEGSLKMYLVAIPYVWLVLFIAFIILADYQIRNTKQGYKYSLHTLIISGLLLSSLLGILLYTIGFAEYLDEQLSEYSETYREYANPNFFMFDNDEHVVFGKIILLGDEEFTLKEPGGKEWLIEFDDDIPLQEGMRVRVIGELGEDGNTFEAEIVRPAFPGDRKRHLNDSPELRERLEQFKGWNPQKMPRPPKSERKLY